MTENMKYKKASYHLWTFLISKMVSSLGSNVYSFGMSLYILQMTGSALSFAMNMIFSILPRTIIAPVAGYVADRFPKKPVVLIGQAGAVLTIVGLLLYSLLFELSLPAIYVATMFYSISGAFSGIAFSSSIATLVDGERIQKAMSYNQLSLSVAAIGGPIIGGMLFGFAPMSVFLMIIIVGYTIALLLESTMDFTLYSTKMDLDSSTKKEGMLESMKLGFSYLKTKPVVMMILWVSLWINFFFSALSVGAMYVLLEVLKVNPEHIGIVEASGAIGMVLAAIYMANRKQVKFPLVFSKRGIIVMSSTMGLMTLPLFINMPYVVMISYFIAMIVIISVAGVLTNTPIGVMFQKEVDEEYRGRVFGILETMAMGMMPLGTLIFGVLYDLVPAQWLLLGSCAALLAITLYMIRPSKLAMAHPELIKEEEKVLHSTYLCKKELKNRYPDLPIRTW